MLILSFNELIFNNIQIFAFNGFFIEDKLSSFAKFIIFLTFNYVNFTLIFFRAESFDSAFKIIKGMFSLQNLTSLTDTIVSTNSIIAFAVAFVICFFTKNTLQIISELKK